MAKSRERPLVPAPPPQIPKQRSRRDADFLLGTLLLALLGAGGYAWRLSARADERRAALALVEQGRFADAVPPLQALHDRDPDDLEVLGALIAAKIRANHLLSEVEPLLDRLCAQRPDDAVALRTRLGILARLRRQEDAIRDARRVLELEPNDDATRRALADLLLAAGDPAGAAAEARRLTAGRSHPPRELRLLLANALQAAGDAAGAAEALDSILREDPEYAPALALRGVALVEAGRFAEAVPLLRKGLAAPAPQRQAARYHLGLALSRSGKPDEASKEFAALAREQTADRYVSDAGQRPDDRALATRAAEALVAADRRDEAVAFLQQVVERDPEHAAAHRLLAELYERASDAARAADHRRRAGP